MASSSGHGAIPDAAQEFMVRLPIPHDRVVSVERASATEVQFPRPEIKVEMVVKVDLQEYYACFPIAQKVAAPSFRV